MSIQPFGGERGIFEALVSRAPRLSGTGDSHPSQIFNRSADLSNRITAADMLDSEVAVVTVLIQAGQDGGKVDGALPHGNLLAPTCGSVADSVGGVDVDNVWPDRRQGLNRVKSTGYQVPRVEIDGQSPLGKMGQEPPQLLWRFGACLGRQSGSDSVSVSPQFVEDFNQEPPAVRVGVGRYPADVVDDHGCTQIVGRLHGGLGGLDSLPQIGRRIVPPAGMESDGGDLQTKVIEHLSQLSKAGSRELAEVEFPPGIDFDGIRAQLGRNMQSFPWR